MSYIGYIFQKQNFNENGQIKLRNTIFTPQTSMRITDDLGIQASPSLIEMFFKKIESQPLMSEHEIKTKLSKYVPGQFSDQMNAKLDFEIANKRKNSDQMMQIFDPSKMFVQEKNEKTLCLPASKTEVGRKMDFKVQSPHLSPIRFHSEKELSSPEKEKEFDNSVDMDEIN